MARSADVRVPRGEFIKTYNPRTGKYEYGVERETNSNANRIDFDDVDRDELLAEAVRLNIEDA